MRLSYLWYNLLCYRLGQYLFFQYYHSIHREGGLRNSRSCSLTQREYLFVWHFVGSQRRHILVLHGILHGILQVVLYVLLGILHVVLQFLLYVLNSILHHILHDILPFLLYVQLGILLFLLYVLHYILHYILLITIIGWIHFISVCF